MYVTLISDHCSRAAYLAYLAYLAYFSVVIIYYIIISLLISNQTTK